MLRARLREEDVAAHLDVDPKTVRRWLSGRVPYPGSRAALADLVGADEADLWPDAGGPLSGQTRPQELVAVYPHRFRHHFSHTWLDRGGPEGDLMELNGWTSPQMLRRYGAGARSARARRTYDRIMTDTSLTQS